MYTRAYDGAGVNGRKKIALFFWKTAEIFYLPFTPAPPYVLAKLQVAN